MVLTVNDYSKVSSYMRPLIVASTVLLMDGLTTGSRAVACRSLSHRVEYRENDVPLLMCQVRHTRPKNTSPILSDQCVLTFYKKYVCRVRYRDLLISVSQRN